MDTKNNTIFSQIILTLLPNKQHLTVLMRGIQQMRYSFYKMAKSSIYVCIWKCTYGLGTNETWKHFFPSSKEKKKIICTLCHPSTTTSKLSNNPHSISCIPTRIPVTAKQHFQYNVYICAHPLQGKLLTWFLYDLKLFKSNNLSFCLLFFLWLD